MKFSECVDSQKYNDVVAQNNELAQSLGVSATPTFLVIKQGRQPENIVGAQLLKFISRGYIATAKKLV